MVRLPSIKLMRTLWICALAGGSFQYTDKKLRDAHFDIHIPPGVFDEVSAELGLVLDYFKVPKREKEETLAAFNSQKPDVTAGVKSKATHCSLETNRSSMVKEPREGFEPSTSCLQGN